MRRYSEAFKADIRKQMSPPARQRVARISEETGIHIATLYAWRKGWRPPAFRKDDTPLNRKPGGLMEQSNASLQRGDQG